MKKISLILVVVISVYFSQAFFSPIGHSNRVDAGGGVVERAESVFEEVGLRISSFINFIVEEIRYRQQVIEKEIERRREDFIDNMMEGLGESLKYIFD